MKEVTWKNIDTLESMEITYLLYLEGKDIKTIGLIRNMDRLEIERHIIEAKIKYRAYEGNNSTEDIMKKLMKYRREERGTILEGMLPGERGKLEKYAIKKLFDSAREECVFYIWLLGELKSRESVTSILAFLKAEDGNTKRMSCSALGKIGDIRAEEGLIKVLGDSRPQVREYAIKALGKIGSKKSYEFLRRLIENPEEKEYVKRAALAVMEELSGAKEVVSIKEGDIGV